jgi:hypothetical protein
MESTSSFPAFFPRYPPDLLRRPVLEGSVPLDVNPESASSPTHATSAGGEMIDFIQDDRFGSPDPTPYSCSPDLVSLLFLTWS